MTDLNFPLNPNVGDSYTVGSRTWIWTGTAWQLQSAVQNLDPFTVKTLVVTSTTNATGTDTGSVTVAGGAGIAGDLYVGGTIYGTLDASVNTATNLFGGSTGSILYQESTGVTGFIGIGPAGSLLQSDGTTATWVTTANIYVANAIFANSATYSSSAGLVDVVNYDQPGDFYLTFVDSNNNSSTSEQLYTTSSIVVNPNTGQFGINSGTPSATLDVNGDAIISGITTITNLTTSGSTNTGALVVYGGAGIGGDLNVGGNLNVTGVINATITGSITTATNLAGGSAHQIAYQANVGQTEFSSDLIYVDSTKQFSVGVANIWANTFLAAGISNAAVVSVDADAGSSIQLASNTSAQLNYNDTTFVKTDSAGIKLIVGNNTATFDTSGVFTLQGAAQTADYLGSGALRIYGGIWSSDNVYITNNISGNTLTGRNLTDGRVVYTNNSQLTDNANLLFDGSALQVPAFRATGTSTFQSTVTIDSTATSNTTTNGALVVTGGVGIRENLNVGGNLHVWGPTTFSSPVTFSGTATYVFSTNTVYTDNILELHTTSTGVGGSWTFDDGKDIGFRFHYYNRTLNSDANAALVLANDTQWLEWYNTGAESTSGTFAGASYGGFKAGQIWLADTINATTSTQSGTAQIDGGASVAKDLWVGGNIYQGGNLVVTQNQLSTATVTAILAGPGISVTTSSGVVTVSNTATLQFVTDNGASTNNAISITNLTTASSPTTGALTVAGGAGIGGNLYVGGNIVAPWSFVDSTAMAGTNSTSNWWIRVLSFTLPNVGDSTTIKVRTNAKVLNNTTYSDNSDSDYAYISYVKTTVSAVVGSIYVGQENTTPANSFTPVNYNLTFNSNTGYFELWRRSTIAGGRIYTRIEETLPTGIQPIIDTTTTWIAVPPQQGTTATSTAINPGSLGTIVASGITITGTAALGSNSTGATVNIANGGSTATKFVNIATGALAGSTGTVTIGSAVAGALERFVVNTTVTQFTSTAQATSTSTGAIQVRGGVGIGGNLYASTVYSRDKEVITSVDLIIGNGINISSVSTSSGAFVASLNNSGVLSLTAGTDTVITTSTGNIAIWNNSTLQSITDRGSSTTNVIRISNATSSTSAQTGALIVDGGLGVGGDLWIGGILYSGGQAVLTTSSFVNSISAGVDIAITELTSGTVVISNTSTLQTVTSRGSTTSNILYLTNTTAASSTNSGALQVAGGVGIGGNLYVGGSIYGTLIGSASSVTTVAQTTNAAHYLTFVDSNNSAFANESVYTTSSFVINPSTGNVGIGTATPSAKLHISDATSPIIRIDAGVASIADPTIQFHSDGEQRAYILADRGPGGGQEGFLTFATHPAGGPGSAATERMRITSTGNIGIGTTTATSLLHVNGTTLLAGVTTITNTTVASSTATGALQVAGGVGIGNNVIVGGYGRFTGMFDENTTTAGVYAGIAGSGTPSPRFGFFNGTADQNWQIDNYNGDFRWYTPGITRMTLSASGNLTIPSSTATTSPTTGAVVVTGGVGIGQDLYVGGIINVQKTVANPAATTVNTSPVTLDSFATTEYRSAKYFISISNTATNQFQTSEIWLVQDGTYANIEQTSVFSSGTTYVVTFSTDITGGIVSLIGTGINSNNKVKIQTTYIAV